MEEKKYKFVIDEKEHSWHHHEITGEELRNLAEKSAEYDVWMKEHGKDKEIKNEEKVKLSHDKIEVFFTVKRLPYKFILDQKEHSWEHHEVSGEELKKLANVPLDYGVWLKEPTKDKEIKNEEKVRLTHGKIDVFFTGKKKTTEG